jgi:hypothetical protein
MRAHPVKLIFLGSVLALAPFVADAGGPYQFYSITPCRIVDTRGPTGPTGGPSLASATIRSFPITGICGVPTTAQQVFLNVTVVGPTQSGWIALWPYNTTRPTPFSNINFPAASPPIANGALVTLTSDPNFNVSVTYGAAASGTTDLLIDILGYLQ